MPFQYVKLPDGSYGKFDEGASDDEIKTHIAKDFPQAFSGVPRPAGLPAGTDLPGMPGIGRVGMTPSMLGRDQNPGVVANALKGAVKSVPGTLSGIDNMVAKLPGGTAMTTPLVGGTSSLQARTDLQNAAQTHGTAQAIGKGLGNAAQFMIPGGAEEALAARAPALLGSVIPKMAAGALGSAVVNKAQGGTATAGAIAGGLGGAVGAAFKAAAPELAESALGVRAADRAYGRTPGQAILAETTGIKPASIARQASAKVESYTNELEDSARTSPAHVDLTPARTAQASFQRTANLENNTDTMHDVGKIAQQLTQRQGMAIPQSVPAYEGLMLKRGLGALTQYNPNSAGGLADAAVKGTVKSLEPGLEAAIPDYSALNSRISTLIPVAKRADAADLNANVLQRVVGRVARPTGALLGATGGGYEGYREGGVPGAVAGAAAGLVLPELLANPTTLMMEARGMASPVTARYALPAAYGLAAQLPRKR